MNIWIVNQYAVPATAVGGTRHQSLARHLRALGHDVAIIASDRNLWTKSVQRAGHDAALESVAGVPFYWIAMPVGSDTLLGRGADMVRFAVKVLRASFPEAMGTPDAVIGSTPNHFVALAAMWLARRKRCPFVLEVRDLWPQTLIDLGRLSAHHPGVKLFSLLERTLYRRADAVLSLLPSSLDYIAARRGRADGIHWLPNGIDLDMVNASEAPIHETFEVMYVGAHGMANGMDSLLETARIVQTRGGSPRVHFRFVGDGPVKAELMERAREWGLRDVTFEAAIPKNCIHRAMAKADAFIVTLKDAPLYRWGVSLNKLYDYLAVGRPIVFGADTPHNPVLEADAGIVTPPEDAEAMAAAVLELAAMPAQARMRLGRNGRAFVARHHDNRALAKELERILCELTR